MQDEQDEMLNMLLAGQGSVSEQTRMASKLDDQHLQKAVPRSEYAKVEWERRLAQRTTDAVNHLGDKVIGLMETIHRASQGIQEKTDRLLDLYNSISRSQGRQQKVVIALTIVLAASTIAYTWITWQSVSAMREANEIQRQLLRPQEISRATPTPPNPTAETDVHKSGASGSP